MSESDWTAERAALLAQVAAYLEWEVELGGAALPRLERLPSSAAPRTDPTSARAVPAPSPPEELPSHAQSRPAAASRTSGSAALPPAARAPGPPQASLLGPQEATGTRADLAALAQSTPVAPPASSEERHTRLALLDREVRACTRCELHKGRTHSVFARGNPGAALMLVGEGPGQEEDKTGQPFVGPAGQLLDKMVGAMGLGRDEVYICNVVKCRPPGNRTPLPSEAGACARYLLGQIDLVRPRVIVALGRCAAENMGLVAGGSWRGRWGRFREVDVMPTYHPAFLLRSPEFKRPVWEDLQKVMAKLRQGA